MTKRFFKSYRAAFALAAALGLLLLLAPGVLADEVDAGTDRIEISETGAVTLVSGHLAAEQVSSVEFELKTEGEVSFSFDGAIAAGWLTNCVAGDGTLHIYIAGTAPLIPAGNSRLIGTVTDPQSVHPADETIRYVYGRRTMAANAGPEEELPGDENTARGRLENALADMSERFSGAHQYTDATWEKLNDAIAQAYSLLESEDASDEDLTAALEALHQAVSGLVNAGMADLTGVLADAKALLTAAQYTADSYAELEQAIQNAQTVVDKGDGAQAEEITAAITALRAAMNGLVEYSGADGSGRLYPDGYDPGTGGGSGGNTRSGGQTADPGNDTAPAPSDTPAGPAPSAGPESQNATPVPTFMPSERTPSQIPHTGDETPLLLPLAVLCLCGGALAALLLRLRRRAGSR